MGVRNEKKEKEVIHNQSDLEFRVGLVKSDWINQTGQSNLTSLFDWINLDWLNVNQSDLSSPVSEFTLSG